MGGSTSSGQFVIEEITGVIRLHGKAISLDRDKYELNVTAKDDGACCVNGEATTHTSTAVVSSRKLLIMYLLSQVEESML